MWKKVLYKTASSALDCDVKFIIGSTSFRLSLMQMIVVTAPDWAFIRNLTVQSFSGADVCCDDPSRYDRGPSRSAYLRDCDARLAMTAASTVPHYTADERPESRRRNPNRWLQPASANSATPAIRPGRPAAATGEVNALLDDGSICRERRRRRSRFWIDCADGQASRNDPDRKYGAVVVRLPISRGFDGRRANGARWLCWPFPPRRPRTHLPGQLFLDVSGPAGVECAPVADRWLTQRVYERLISDENHRRRRRDCTG